MDPVNPDADLQGPNLDPEVPHAEERSPAGRESEANRGGKGGNWDEDRSETYRAHGAVAGGVAGFTATDPGMDDLTFTWEWGDGTPATISFYPNGGAFPIAATDEETRAYPMAGIYDLKLTVRDDEGGIVDIVLTVVTT